MAADGSHAFRMRYRKSLFTLLLVFVVACSLVGYVFSSFPESDHFDDIRFPRNIQDVKDIRGMLASYTTDHFVRVIVGFSILYVFMQAFAIPGSLMLSVLAGALFGMLVGFAVVCFCATSGATLCYLISYYIGRPVVHRFFHQKLLRISHKVQEQKDSLFSWMLFLRISPILPNWFINMTSPLLDIPLSTFFFATAFGGMPANFTAVKAGLTLSELQSMSDVIGPKMLAALTVLGLVALVPVALRKYMLRFVKNSKV